MTTTGGIMAARVSASEESRLADAIEEIILCIEAGDARPSLPEYVPVLSTYDWPLLRRFRRGELPDRPIGLVLLHGRGNGFVLHEVRTASLSERMRLHRLGRIDSFTRPLGVVAEQRIDRDTGRAGEPMSSYFRRSRAGRGGGTWVPVACDPAGGEMTAVIFSLAESMGVAVRVCWSVSFGTTDGRYATRVPTDEAGVAGLYRLRDKPAGRSRRESLLHWVREHRRETPGGTAVGVKGHLRGADEFDWFGMRCRVIPPAEKDTK